MLRPPASTSGSTYGSGAIGGRAPGGGDPHGTGGRGGGAGAWGTEPRGSGSRAGPSEPSYAGRPAEAGRGTGVPGGYGPVMGGTGAGMRDGQDHRNRYVVPTGEVFDIEITATDAVLGPDEGHR